MKTRLSFRSTSSIFSFAKELQATTLLAARGLMPFWRDAADAPRTAATLKPATAKAPVTPWAALLVLDVEAKKPGACAATETSLCTSICCRLWPGARKARPPREAAPRRPPARTLDERAIVRRRAMGDIGDLLKQLRHPGATCLCFAHCCKSTPSLSFEQEHPESLYACCTIGGHFFNCSRT